MAQFTSRLQVMIRPHEDAVLEKVAERHNTSKSFLVRALVAHLTEREDDGDLDFAEDVLMDEAQRITPLPRKPRSANRRT